MVGHSPEEKTPEHGRRRIQLRGGEVCSTTHADEHGAEKTGPINRQHVDRVVQRTAGPHRVGSHGKMRQRHRQHTGPADAIGIARHRSLGHGTSGRRRGVPTIQAETTSPYPDQSGTRRTSRWAVTGESTIDRRTPSRSGGRNRRARVRLKGGDPGATGGTK